MTKRGKTGKRSTIRPVDEAEIIEIVIDNRRALDTGVLKRTDLAEKMQKDIKWLGLPPQIEVLEKRITKYKKLSIADMHETPWSMGTLDGNNISTDGLPGVLIAFGYSLKHNVGFSVREAKWAARIWAARKLISVEIPPGYLHFIASIYARYELVQTISGSSDLDTTALDRAFLFDEPAPGDEKHFDGILARIFDAIEKAYADLPKKSRLVTEQSQAIIQEEKR